MPRRKPKKAVSLPVVSCSKPRAIRKSRNAPRRAIVLAVVQVLMIVHIVQWAITGTTITPIEPSESMATASDGVINAGALFFAAALLSTVLLGRWFCGWGCHVVMLQDLCAWIMRRFGIRPKPFRSRLLVYVPFILALYMFVAPVVYRFAMVPLADRVLRGLGPDHDFVQWLHGVTSVLGFPLPRDDLPRFGFSWHLITSDFWATFTTWGVAIPFFLICGFATVYLLGSKGFCTYGCPYGGFFAPLDELAPGRIRVNDACEHCGHCTSVCSSNVRVHEEVREYGMVVDPGCMKCLDCVSVCPNDALSFGFGRSATFKGKPKNAPIKRKFDLTRREEIAIAGVFLLCFLSFRGIYGLIPMLMAAGMAGCIAWLAWKLWRLLRDESVALHRFRLKYKGRWRRSGVVFALLAGALLVLTAHSGVVRAAFLMADYHDSRVRVPASFVFTGDRVLPPETMRDHAASGLRWYAIASSLGDGGIGLLDTWQPQIDVRRAWLHSTRFEFAEAEAVLRRAIARRGESEPAMSSLARILRARNDVEGARELYESALRRHAGWSAMLDDYLFWARDEGLMPQAAQVCRDRLSMMDPQDEGLAETRLHTMRWLSIALVESGRLDEGIAVTEQTLVIDPGNPAAWRALAQAHLAAGHVLEAYDAVGTSLDLNADDATTHLVAAEVLRLMGDDARAEEHLARARSLTADR